MAEPLVEPASSGDQSVMEAFNRRDMDDVDRAVAARSGSAAEPVAPSAPEGAEKRSCTNRGTQNEDGDAEVRNVKPRFNFDEARRRRRGRRRRAIANCPQPEIRPEKFSRSDGVLEHAPCHKRGIEAFKSVESRAGVA